MLKDILEGYSWWEIYYDNRTIQKSMIWKLYKWLYFEKSQTLSTMQWGHRQPKRYLCNLYNQRIMIEKCWTLGTGISTRFTNKQWYQVIEDYTEYEK